MHNLFDAVSQYVTANAYRKGRHKPYINNGCLVTTAPVDSNRTGKMWFTLTQNLDDLSACIAVHFHQTTVLRITTDYLYVNVTTHVEHPSHRRWCEMLFSILRSVYPLEMRFVSHRQDPLRYTLIRDGRVKPHTLTPAREWQVQVTLNGRTTYMREASVLFHLSPFAVDYTTGENTSELLQSVAVGRANTSSIVEGTRALIAEGKSEMSDFALIAKPYWYIKQHPYMDLNHDHYTLVRLAYEAHAQAITNNPAVIAMIESAHVTDYNHVKFIDTYGEHREAYRVSSQTIQHTLDYMRDRALRNKSLEGALALDHTCDFIQVIMTQYAYEKRDNPTRKPRSLKQIVRSVLPAFLRSPTLFSRPMHF